MMQTKNILKWYNRERSDAEIRPLLSDEDFGFHIKLKSFTDNATLTSINMDEHFDAIKQKMQSPKVGKPLQIKWVKYGSIAATLALFFGLFQLFFFSNKTLVASGNTKTLLLPDNSVVVLNSNTKLSYPPLFQINRKIKLSGEAYFEVQKGSVFKVITPQGTVRVLGTKFNVTSYQDWFEVTCFEGEVEVITKKQTVVLTPGLSIRSYQNILQKINVTHDSPPWIHREYTFRSVPLKFVFQSFSNIYDKKINLPADYNYLLFTGGFVPHDREKALQSICIPVGLSYKIENEQVILTKK